MAGMRNRWAVAGLALSLVALGVLATRLNLNHVARALAQANWWWVAASALAHILSTIVESARWNVIISSVMPHPRLRDAFVALSIGTVGNIVLPLKLGEGARAWALSRLGNLPFSSAFPTVIADRVIDAGVFLVLSLLVAATYPPASGVFRPVLICLVALAFLGGVLWVVSRHLGRLRHLGLGHARPWTTRIHAAIDRVLSSLRSTRHLGPACVVSVVAWIVKALVVWTMFRAFGFDLSLVAAGASLTIIILGVVAVSTPANVGVFELSTVLAVSIHQVPADTAFGFAVILHAAELGPTVILGLAAMWKLGIHMSDLKTRLREECGP